MEINGTIRAAAANHGSSRATNKIKYIVVHYTGNKTDKAENNALYFKNNTVKASAHYFVDDATIYQSVPDTITAWSVGGAKYNDCATTGGGSLYGKVTNTNSLNIELCSVNGEITEKTQKNAQELIKQLMAKYSVPAENVVRHFDVNGKHCPGWGGWFGKDAPKWALFKAALVGKTEPKTEPKAEPAKAPTTTTATAYKVTAKAGVNIRQKASASSAKLGAVAYNTKIKVSKTEGEWGYCPSVSGWICLKYCVKA